MEKHSQHYPPSTADPLRIGAADDAILRAINKLQYMTAAQVGRLLYPDARDENRYVQRRLRRLAEAGYLLRLRELPSPRVGSAPHVFTLADRGRKYLEAQAVALSSLYYRPSEEYKKARDNPFMEHTIAAVDVLVAAERLATRQGILLPRLLTERQLKRNPARVQPLGHPDARPVAVIPDAWFELVVAGDPPVCIALELDRGTEEQQYWRRKIAALSAWAIGPYRHDFQTDNLTIATLAPTAKRRRQLDLWTQRELEAIGRPDLGEIFLFGDTSPVAILPEQFFFDPLWYPAGETQPVSLLDAPSAPAAAEPTTSSTTNEPSVRPYVYEGGVKREYE
jgi:hypothetical protein